MWVVGAPRQGRVKGAPPSETACPNGVFSMSTQSTTSVDEADAQIALLEELIGTIEGRLEHATTAPGSVDGEQLGLAEQGEVSTIVAMEELLEEKKAELEAAKSASTNTWVDEETSILEKNLSRYSLFASNHTHYWCPKWDAVIQYGGHSTTTKSENDRRGCEYVTHITFAVTELARRDGLDVYRDTRARLMDARELPATEALALVDDHCVPLGRYSASGEATDPHSQHDGVQKYRLRET
jgi:hypothetical protein